MHDVTLDLSVIVRANKNFIQSDNKITEIK